MSAGVLVVQTTHGSWVTSSDRAIWIPARTWHEHRAYGASRLRAVLHDRLRRAAPQPISLPAPSDSRLARACAIALDNLTTPMSLPALAAAAGTTERTLSRLFRTQTGMSYPQ